ncbi:ABC transporter [Rhodococcus sp. BP-349]|uniref:ABC transporter n=1 Tax=unclassified Rhodococcus (in: high G+C Gram-positive bacteria) TaxID=192944 RepID=UPI001C9B6B99|nr:MULTISPECIES: ABC transporter [unclassified Rhodococcus (in: high G+C Gram-positive bacteria)]MBY6540392.1 ABC transporter [Rhodococcus sp. BP-363]MBY6545583.1 ABC transporter [Rhodococcus sp. BP-369]MBY6564813.1 ABC transporter [Rhodococcus sp. BP-370]MBY6578251.1 ABC transporter [Rhodococcus sp. BP-364]MBY6587552.1 ABC transporter [Rhodococcus sp. BP-358]
MRHHITTTALALVVGLTACSTEQAPTIPADEAPVEGHGAIADAAELAEPRLGLTTIDPTGSISHLDLLDESVSDLGAIGAPEAMSTDGRYLFARTDAGIEIVDSGVWTWDHVDHFHYYRAEPRLLGTVQGAGAATVATSNQSTSGGTGLYFPDTGDAVLLDTEALSKGEISESFRLRNPPGDGMVVPVGSFALVTDGVGPSRTVVGHTSDGTRTGLVESCPDAAGTITTRVGTVVGCSDGALLASSAGDELTVEKIPYPADDIAPPAVSFDNREGRPAVAGLAGDQGIWLLDTRQRSWTLLPAPTRLAHVSAIDDSDDHVLALTADGRVFVLDGADGSVLAETGALVAASLAAGEAPTLIADQQRAYLSAPTERKLYEIDYADDARVSRTFETASEPAFTAETGR